MFTKKINLIFFFLIIYVATLSWQQAVIETISGFLEAGLHEKIVQKDFVNYWLAGRFVIDGHAIDLYEFETYFSQMKQMFGDDIEIRAWSYPTHTLLFLWPLGLLSYKAAILVFFGAGFFLYVLAANLFFRKFGEPEYRILFWFVQIPFFMLTIFAMQNGLHLAALFIFGIVFMRDRPVIAGLCFAIMTVKPQLGIFIPFLLLFNGAWRTIIWAVVFTVILLVLSTLIFGTAHWQAFINSTIPYQTSVMHVWNGFFLELMPSLFASLRVIGIESHRALDIHLIFAAVLVPLILYALYKSKNDLASSFIALAGTFLVTPYSFNYDMGAFAIVCGTYVTLHAQERTKESLWWAFLGVLCSLILFLKIASFQLLPVILLASLLWFSFNFTALNSDSAMIRTKEK